MLEKLHVLFMSWWIRYALLFTSYLPAKPELNCLKATAKLSTLWSYCQRKHFTHLLSKIGIKHVFSTIFSTVLELLQTVYRQKTELQLWIARAWSLFLGSRKISSCPGLKTLRPMLIDAWLLYSLTLYFYHLFYTNSMNIRFKTGVLNTLKYSNSPILVKN